MRLVTVGVVAGIVTVALLVSYGKQVKPVSIELNATPSVGAAPLDVEFCAVIQGGQPPYEVRLELGDGAVVTLPADGTYRHAYSRPQEYHATVTVTDGGGSMASDTLIIEVLAAQFVPGEVIVGYAGEQAPAELENLIHELGGAIITENKAGRFFLVSVNEGVEAAFIDLILARGGGMIAYAELNYIAEVAD
jgi:hypothetical protein